MNYVAFDLGGSGGKVVLGTYQDNQLSLQVLHKFRHAPIPLSNGLYWNTLQIYQELLCGLRIAIQTTKDSIRSLGIDSFCNDYAFISPSGELLTQVHCYRDERTKRHADKIYRIMSKEKLYQVNGNQNARFNTLMQLAAMQCENQSYYFQEGNTLLFLPDLLIYFLTGKKLTEYTLASVSQMYDFNLQAFSPTILHHYQIPAHIFTKIVWPGNLIAHTTKECNNQLNTKGFQIASVCEHDTASAFLASISDDNCAIISCGTWALVGTETSFPIINNYGYKYNIANEGGYDGHHRILRNVMGTWIIQEVQSHYKKLGTMYSFPELEALALNTTPFQYFIDVDDELFFSPGHMPEKIQSYCRQIYGNVVLSIGEIIRCIYESLAMKYRYNIEKIQKLTGKNFTYINIIGGGSQSELMCQFTANICQIPVYAGPIEATAIGNIMIQLIADKQIKSIEQGRALVKKSFPYKLYKPQNSSKWNKQYEKFLARLQP